jgi:GxxExxY protein
MLAEEQLTEAIIGALIEVHRALGPGLLESAYVRCTARELELRGIAFRKEVDLPVIYKGVQLDCGYRMDLVIEEKVVLEIKSVDKLAPIHEAQLLTYLRLSGFRIGLLVNFNSPTIKNAIIRRVL